MKGKLFIIIFGSILLPSLTLLIFMGLFSKMFGGKNNNSEQPDVRQSNSLHQEDWGVYLCNVDNKVTSIVVDLGLHKIAPIKDKPNVAWVSLKINNPSSDGFPVKEEMFELDEIEHNLANLIPAKHNAIYVGHLNSDGRRDVYFYFGDTTLYDKTISDVMAAYPKYKFQYGSKEDKDWDGYLNFLYPKPEQLQSIQNARVIDNLEKHGDKLTKARAVDHWIYFKSDNDREKFLSKIKGKKFEIVEKSYDESNTDFFYGLHLTRNDKVDQQSVDEYTVFLWKVAHECNGDYDGWETFIIRE